jgi:hypothetical protein
VGGVGDGGHRWRVPIEISRDDLEALQLAKYEEGAPKTRALEL